MALTRKQGILMTGAAAAVLLTAGTIGVAGASTNPAQNTGSTQNMAQHMQNAAQQPPKGARAVVQVSPNPTTERGQEITITGNCGGGTGLKAVVGGSFERPTLVNITILKSDPAGFLAKANVAPNIGNGVGPVLVDCGGEAGVTLLVTHV
ncbi:hypothetical protein OG943_17945 [Amycolatopsis sp. NBC_00345]|uniref:hypothetical protein n=1 Tax=Amycolatopsis sp. NBC_00345 TaxID=2975955 RepID=UPI002E25B357